MLVSVPLWGGAMDRQIGIVGAGIIGAGIGRFFSNAGWRVAISSARGPGGRAGVTARLGAGAAPVADAIAAEVVLLPVPWGAVESVLRDAPPWNERVLIDATNAIKVYAPPRVELYEFGGQTSSEVVAGLAPGARVVKAFNHLPFGQLTSPVHGGERRASFLCGDDAGAKADVAAVLEGNGFAPIDLGRLREGSPLQ